MHGGAPWWRYQAARGREPDDIAKLALGCLWFAVGTLWLAAAQWVAGADGRAPLLWAVAFHLISNLGWLYHAPIAAALYAAKAPPAWRGTLMGISLLTVFTASIISGRLGGLYEAVTPAQFWLLHAVIVGAGWMVLLVLGRPLRRMLAGDAEAAVR